MWTRAKIEILYIIQPPPLIIFILAHGDQVAMGFKKNNFFFTLRCSCLPITITQLQVSVGFSIITLSWQDKRISACQESGNFVI